MKKIIFILAFLPIMAAAQETLDSLIGCYAGTFMYREDPDTVWTTVRPDTLIVFDVDTMYESNGNTIHRDVVSWLLVEPNTIFSDEPHYIYYENDIGFCTLGLGFDECNYSTLEEVRQAYRYGMVLVFIPNDSVHFFVEDFQPSQYDPMRNAWFKGVKYTSEIPDSLQNISAPIIRINNLGITLYPNPVNEVLNITLSKKEKVKVTIHDITGKEIYCSDYNLQYISINFKHYAKGVYLVTVKNKNGAVTKKIIY